MVVCVIAMIVMMMMVVVMVMVVTVGGAVGAAFGLKGHFDLQQLSSEADKHIFDHVIGPD